jgi:CRP-like cAMP-binding protein
MAPLQTERVVDCGVHSGAPAGTRSAKPVVRQHSGDRPQGGSRGDRYPRILDMLDSHDRGSLLSLASEKLVGKGQFLYHQGDSSNALFIILTGTVKVF